MLKKDECIGVLSKCSGKNGELLLDMMDIYKVNSLSALTEEQVNYYFNYWRQKMGYTEEEIMNMCKEVFKSDIEIKAEMTANEYQRLAARTINNDLVKWQQQHHALHGMVGEIGEIHSIYQKAYQGHDSDDEHLKKEVGDLLWFVAEYCTSNGWNLGDIMQMNIDKLKARFPEGFEVDKSLNRKEGDI